MNLVDIFGQDLFSTTSLTAAINKMPHIPGRLGELGLFEEEGVNTNSVLIEERQGTLRLIQSRPRGSEANQETDDKRQGISIPIPHLPDEDRLNASEVQGVRAFGSADEMLGVEQKVNEKLTKIGTNLDATLEFHRIGAVKGQVLDADATPLVDLFTTFGVAQLATVQFDLANGAPAAGALRTAIHGVIRSIEDELGAADYTGIACHCGSGFFDKLVTHPETAKAYERWAARQADGQPGDFLRMRMARRNFAIHGVLFEEYRGKVNGTDFIAEEDAHFYPVGVQGLFKTYFGPADFMEAVNTIGLPRYVKAAMDPKFQRYIDLHSQTNPLNICTRPRVLVKGNSAA